MSNLEYHLSFNVSFRDCKYNCKERIVLESETQKAILDAKDLTIKKVTSGRGKVEWNYDQDEGSLSISGKNIRELELEFEGKAYENRLHGFYKSRYDGGYFLSTQFEPNGARNMFPCFDRPDRKAVFRISVAVEDPELSVISNTLPERIYEEEGKRHYVFEPTPLMSTYLLFLGIGHFAEVKDKGNPDIILAAPPGREEAGELGLRTARASISFFEKYFGIKYPLKKMHLVAIPEYAVGAMENWGCISFREASLLADKRASAREKKNIELTVAHEIAHQWFGDLVTMKWWNDLWLNESFATYMATVAMSAIRGDVDYWSDFLLNETEDALAGDALLSTHPVEVPVKKPEEIEEIFDEISYGKGGSILRMIANFISSEDMRKGLEQYLRRHAYGCSEGKDLWEALEKESGVPVAGIMKEWISKEGYPLLIARVKGKHLEIEQKRYTLSTKEKSGTWPVPLNAVIDGKQVRKVIRGERETIDIEEGREIRLNVMQYGFYRVLYEDKLFEKQIAILKNYPPEERWGLLSDTYSFLISGRVGRDRYKQIVKVLFDDDAYLVRRAIIRQLMLLAEVTGRKEYAEMLTDYCRRLLSMIGESKRHGEDENTASLRESAYTALAFHDEGAAVQYAALRRNMDDEEPEKRQAIYVAWARTAGRKAETELLSLLDKVQAETEKRKILVALVSSKDSQMTKEVLGLCISGKVNLGLVPYAIYGASTLPEHRETVWDWFEANKGTIYENYSGTGITPMMTEFVISRAGLADPERVRRYVRAQEFPGAARAVKKGLEMLDALHAFRKREMADSYN
ncbi:MAG: M1 family metallopeptidase [Methanomassiliicoccales archaeon]